MILDAALAGDAIGQRNSGCTPLLWLMLGLFIFAASACATATPREPSSQSPSDRAASGSLTGLWEGTAVNDCSFIQMERTRCHAVVNIALAMSQQG